MNNIEKGQWICDDLQNEMAINDYCQKKLFIRYKFLPDRWEKITHSVPKTFCHTLMSLNIIMIPPELE